MAKQTIFTLCAAVALLAGGCKKNHQSQPEATNSQTGGIKTINAMRTVYAEDDGPTVLGDQYGNPYLTSTMAEAQKQLDARGIRSANQFTVRTTQLYVKFMPENEEEYNVLTSDETIELYDCPMDYEKVIVGNWYQDPEVDESTPSPQYAAVPADFEFNETIPYEILAELYLPEQDKELRGEALSENSIYLKQLLEEAYNLTVHPPPIPDNNFYPDDPSGGDYSGGYAMPGKIQVFDTRLGHYIPLAGVKVTARVSMFTTYSGFTDGNGDYFLDDGFVTGTADYAIKFQRAGFSIKRNRFMNAYISRVNQSGSHWSYGIDAGRDRMHAHMFRGAFRYYYGDIAGLPRPGKSEVNTLGVITFEVNQGIVSTSGHNAAHLNGQGINFILAPTLWVARYSNDDDTEEWGSDDIFSTTIHELAHTSHYNTMLRDAQKFVKAGNTIRESFALGVEWLLTSMEYREEQGITDYGAWNYNPSPIPNFPAWHAYQYWNSGDDGSSYTSLFINLMDDFNELNQNFPFEDAGTVDDRVSGYNLGDIQRIVLPHTQGTTHAQVMSQFESWLLTISNPTSANVPTLIEQY